MIKIVHAGKAYFPSFHQALDSVAREGVHIEMVEAPSLREVSAFQDKLIKTNCPVFYAVDDNNQVVGWCDIARSDNPRLCHRGSLGMGLVQSFRGQGIGSQLIKAALDHGRQISLEKVELMVFTDNAPAIALYKRFGFFEEGVRQKYRKLGAQYFDCLMMGLFL